MNTEIQTPPGKFIVIEGLDGSGITEQTELIREWLRHEDFDLNRVSFTHEPSDGPVGLMLDLVMQGRMDMDEETIALLFAADRRDHLTRFVLPRMEKGIHVVSERYYLSFYAYQAGQGLSMEWLRTIGKTWRRPDLVIVLDTPLEQCLTNINKRFSISRYEKEKTLQKTWDEFRRLIAALRHDGEKIHLVDGRDGGQPVHARILPLVQELLFLEGA